MKTERFEMNGVTILRLAGDIDEGGIEPLRQSLMDCIQDQRYNVVVNMDAVKFVSYMGVGVLIERLRMFRSFGGDLKLSGINMYTERLFRMAGVHNVFSVHKNESQAIQEYQQAA
jgi:anti-sigma B factor antagonist